MLINLHVPVSWREILRRTYASFNKDDALGLAAELAYAFFFSLFPALIFLVALASFFPLQGLIDQLTSRAGAVVPDQVMSLITGQMKQISNSNQGGLLTFGILLTLYSASSGMAAIIDTLNRAYDIEESRPWWKVRLTAVGLVVVMGIFVLVSLALVMVGPTVAERFANVVGLGAAFATFWRIIEWPIVFILIALGVGVVYYEAPDAEQEWVWITPGSLAATILWILASVGFRVYLAHFNSYNATYGAIGGIMIALLWLYITGAVLLLGAELNAEIEHASPYGKAPGEKRPGVKKKIGVAAQRGWERAQRLGHRTPSPAHAAASVRSETSGRLAEVMGLAAAEHVEAQKSQKEDATAAAPSQDAIAAADRGAVPVGAPRRFIERPQPMYASRLFLAALVAGEVAMAVWAKLRRTRTGG